MTISKHSKREENEIISEMIHIFQQVAKLLIRSFKTLVYSVFFAIFITAAKQTIHHTAKFFLQNAQKSIIFFDKLL